VIADHFAAITDKKDKSWLWQSNFAHSDLPYYRLYNEKGRRKNDIANLHNIIYT